MGNARVIWIVDYLDFSFVMGAGYNNIRRGIEKLEQVFVPMREVVDRFL